MYILIWGVHRKYPMWESCISSHATHNGCLYLKGSLPNMICTECKNQSFLEGKYILIWGVPENTPCENLGIFHHMPPIMVFIHMKWSSFMICTDKNQSFLKEWVYSDLGCSRKYPCENLCIFHHMPHNGCFISTAEGNEVVYHTWHAQFAKIKVFLKEVSIFWSGVFSENIPCENLGIITYL